MGVQQNSVEFMEVKSRKALQQERKEIKREPVKPRKIGSKKSSGSVVATVISPCVADVSSPPQTEMSPVQLGPPPAKAWVEPKHTLETLGVKVVEEEERDDQQVAAQFPEPQENVPSSKIAESDRKGRNLRKRENKKEFSAKASAKPSLNTSMIRQHLGFKLPGETDSIPQDSAEQSFSHFSAQIESYGEGQDSAVF